jgi:hypothetical protein
MGQSRLASLGVLLVAGTPVRDLLLCAKHLVVAATEWQLPLSGAQRMSNGTSSALNSEHDLASIPIGAKLLDLCVVGVMR